MYIGEKEAFLQTMTVLKLSVIKKDGEIIKLTREMEKKNEQIKEKEDEAVLLKNEVETFQQG